MDGDRGRDTALVVGREDVLHLQGGEPRASIRYSKRRARQDPEDNLEAD